MVVVLRRCLSCLCVSSRRRSSSSNSRRRSCLCLSSHSLCCRRCRRRPCWCVMFHAPPPPPPPPPPPWPVTKLLQTHFLPNTLAQHGPRRAYRCLSRSRAHPPPPSRQLAPHLTSGQSHPSGFPGDRFSLGDALGLYPHCTCIYTSSTLVRWSTGREGHLRLLSRA